MADSIKTVLFKVDIDTKASQQQIKALKAEIKDMQKAVDSDAKATEAAAKRKEKAIKETTKALQAEEGSINALRASNKKLTQERNNTSAATEEGRKKIQELNKALDENNKKIKENVDAYTAQKINVGNYKDSIKEAANETRIAGLSVDDIGAKMTAFLNPLTATVAGLGALFAAYVSSAAGAKDLKNAQTQLSTAFTLINNDLAKLVGADGKGGGLLSALAFQFNKTFFGMSRAVAGQAAGFAVSVLDELRVVEVEARRFGKEQLDLAEEQRRIRDDTRLDIQERFVAAKTVDTFINARERELVAIQERKLEQLRFLLSLDRDNLDLQLAVKEVEFEIADIREDSQGKRTEAARGIMALELEEIALFKASAEERKKLEDEAAARYFQRIQNELDAEKFALQQRKEFEEEFYAEGGEIDKIHADFNKRLAKDTQDRLRQQETDEKRAAQLQLQIERNKTIALIGFTNMVTKEGTASRVILSTLFKKDAIQETAITTKVAAVSAYKALAGIPYVGPVLGGIAAAAVTAYGLATIAQIVGIPIGFAKGGITGTRIKRNMGSPINRDNGDDVLITAKSDEVILNKRQQRALGGDATFRKIGVPGFALGGITGATETAQVAAQIDQESVFNNMIEALSQTRTVLVLEDFEAKQSTVNGIKNKATVI